MAWLDTAVACVRACVWLTAPGGAPRYSVRSGGVVFAGSGYGDLHAFSRMQIPSPAGQMGFSVVT